MRRSLGWATGVAFGASRTWTRGSRGSPLPVHSLHAPALHVPTRDPLPLATSPDSKTTASALSPQLKLALDMGPLIVFFVTFFVAKRVVEDDTQGMIWATGIFVVVTAIALAVSYAIERKLHAMPLITGAVVLVMGGLTVYFNDERFIKYKPTIVSGLMGSTLLIGWARGKSLIKPLLGSTLELDDAGWRTLTLRWGFFFLVVAGLNELVWRSTTTSVWLNFKLFGILGLTFLFMLLQQPLIQRHSPAPPTED